MKKLFLALAIVLAGVLPASAQWSKDSTGTKLRPEFGPLKVGNLVITGTQTIGGARLLTGTDGLIIIQTATSSGAAVTGALAITGTTLRFYNGSVWKTITTN